MEPLDEVIDGLPETEHRLGRVYRRIEGLERKAQRLREDPVEPEDAERADRFDREAAKLQLRMRDESDELVDFASPNSRDATEGAPNAPGAAGEPVSQPQAPNAKRWTPELVNKARAFAKRLKKNGERAPTEKAAQHFGVSAARLREVFRNNPEPRAAGVHWPATATKRHRIK
jgi:hypothetical protein